MSETTDDPYDPCHDWIARCHELEHENERLRGKYARLANAFAKLCEDTVTGDTGETDCEAEDMAYPHWNTMSEAEKTEAIRKSL